MALSLCAPRAFGQHQTLLHNAVFVGDLDIVRALIAKDPDGINTADITQGNTWVSPLYAAAQHGHVEIVRELLAAGADPNQKTRDNSSPLLAACNADNEEDAMKMAEMLLGAGADPGVRNDMRYNPRKVAASKGYTRLHKLLRQAEKDVGSGTRRMRDRLAESRSRRAERAASGGEGGESAQAEPKEGAAAGSSAQVEGSDEPGGGGGAASAEAPEETAGPADPVVAAGRPATAAGGEEL